MPRCKALIGADSKEIEDAPLAAYYFDFPIPEIFSLHFRKTA